MFSGDGWQELVLASLHQHTALGFEITATSISYTNLDYVASKLLKKKLAYLFYKFYLH